MNESRQGSAPAGAPRFPIWRYLGRLAPLALLWFALIGWLGWLLYSRANWSREADEADVREWLSETRVFRKPLPELVREYVSLIEEAGGPGSERLRVKHAEIEAHLRALAEPTRKYSGKLPLFPELYYLGIDYAGPPPSGVPGHPAWRSPLPRPGVDAAGQIRVVEIAPANSPARVRCEYRVHTHNRFEQEQQNRRYWQIPLVAFLIPTTAASGYFVFRFLRRERDRELQQWQNRVQAEHRERLTEELRSRLLGQQLETAESLKRAAEAERAALELKSQLYASIGIMAGSYAHNIKNLLVRPNDLLARCIDADQMSRDQQGMLHEVKATLATVTERLQQILRTVRRDPSRAEITRIDLNELVRESHRTWAGLAWEKWKVKLTIESAEAPLQVEGDLSHLQQALENLIFNARDATFEMRNHLREEARKGTGEDAAERKKRLIEAASWRGEVAIRTFQAGGQAVLEVRDNGIGMTEEVRQNCLKTHFTTKRDNALYEGYSAGMGLGLSFVAVVLEHHGAELEIESSPLQGATFRVRMPLAQGQPDVP
jgi:signal transduction histidine kinase